MAAIIGDLVPDISRFHDMIVSPSSRHNQRPQQPQQQQQQHQQQQPPQSHKSPRPRQRSCSRSHLRNSPPLSPSSSPSSRVRTPAAPTSRPDGVEDPTGDRRSSAGTAPGVLFDQTCKPALVAANITSTSSRLPTEIPPSPPPSSSSPPAAGCVVPVAKDANGALMASQIGVVVSAAHHTLRNGSNSLNDFGRRQQPSPPLSQSQNFQLPNSSVAASSFPHIESPSSTQKTLQDSQSTVVHVRDLAHMQSLVDAKMLGANSSTSLPQVQYEISGMPIADVIEMVAALLTKITTTNDLQHDAMQRNVAHQQQASEPNDSASSMSSLSHSVLTFHGKNVPAITILSYLSRIHKYCPTTYEVFLSLLVYFDRMTERVNELVVKDEQGRSRLASQSRPKSPHASQKDTVMRSDAHGSDESDSDLADDDDDDDDDEMIDSPTAAGASRKNVIPRGVLATDEKSVAVNPATYFVVDSFNIHRLIISGVTCASKFFSDVFYTNSRYAKVGGLPLAELNHLEIQFLVLNDFRLAVPVEDLEAYATMLVEFYAREVMCQKSAPAYTIKE